MHISRNLQGMLLVHNPPGCPPWFVGEGEDKVSCDRTTTIFNTTSHVARNVVLLIPPAYCLQDSLFSFGSYMSYTSMCCNCTTCLCQPTWPNYMLAQWLAGGAAAVSLVQLPGASATLILENVLLRGSPGHADWLPSGKRNGGQGSALAVRSCFKPIYGPLPPASPK